MALLPTGLLAGRLPQAAGPRRLLQSVTGRRLAAVAAVQPETTLQLGNARLLRQQQRDELVLRELTKGGVIHRLLGIGLPKSCQPKSSPGSDDKPNHPCGHPHATEGPGALGRGTWAVTNPLVLLSRKIELPPNRRNPVNDGDSCPTVGGNHGSPGQRRQPPAVRSLHRRPGQRHRPRRPHGAAARLLHRPAAARRAQERRAHGRV